MCLMAKRFPPLCLFLSLLSLILVSRFLDSSSSIFFLKEEGKKEERQMQ